MGLIVDLHLPSEISTTQLLRAVRAMLDFLYIAQYPVQSTHTLDQLDDALARFHANKEIFVMLGIRAHFKLPKLHNANHYRFLIELYGTTDNCNTQATERLHIDFAKDAYGATNGKDEFTQMTVWLERKEKVLRHGMYIKWRLVEPPPKPPPINLPHIRMTKHPTISSVPFNDLGDDYGAYDIRNALGRFVATVNNPALRGARLDLAASKVFLFFNNVSVFHKVRLANPDPHGWLAKEDVQDVVHVRPAWVNPRRRQIPARFDTVLVDCGNGNEFGVSGALNPSPPPQSII